MLNFAKGLSKIAFKCIHVPYRFRSLSFFSNQKQLNPIYQKLKKTFQQKGRDSKEYQQEMARAMREALSKYDDQTAINLELHHLNLVKIKQGDKSQAYRSQMRQIIKFFMNRQHFEEAVKLVQQLQVVEDSIQNISPLDRLSTFYLQGFIFTELNRLQESKAIFNKCLQMKQVQQTPQIFFKIFLQLARAHAKCGQNQQAYKYIGKCQEIIDNRKYDSQNHPMILVMDLHDIFQLAQLASNLNNKEVTQKYIGIYFQRLQNNSNKKDPMYVEFLQRKARLHFNLQQYSAAVQNLKQAAKILQQLAKTDPNFLQNSKILANIAQSMQKQYLIK